MNITSFKQRKTIEQWTRLCMKTRSLYITAELLLVKLGIWLTAVTLADPQATLQNTR